MENYIIVHHFYDNTTLALAKMKLKNEGIPTQTRDEEIIQTLSNHHDLVNLLISFCKAKNTLFLF